MDFSRVQINRPEFQEMKKGLNSQHLFAEIVLIDRSQEGAKAQLYQLKKDKLTPLESLELLRQEFITLPHPAFNLLGIVHEYDTSKKTISLVDGTVITYKVMLTISGFSPSDEMSSVLQTLKEALMLDALNVKEKMGVVRNPYSRMGPSMFKEKNSRSFSVPSPSIVPHLKYIDQISHHKLCEHELDSSILNHLNSFSSKRCFLQM